MFLLLLTIPVGFLFWALGIVFFLAALLTVLVTIAVRLVGWSIATHTARIAQRGRLSRQTALANAEGWVAAGHAAAAAGRPHADVMAAYANAEAWVAAA